MILWKPKQALLILTQGLNFGPGQSSPFVFTLSFRIVTFFFLFYNGAETHSPLRVNDSSVNDIGYQLQVLFLCHSEHGMPEMLLLCVSEIFYCCSAPPRGDTWHPPTFWIFLNPLLGWSTTTEMHHGSLWVFVCFDRSCLSTRKMRRDDCDVTALHDQDRSLEKPV